MLGFVDRRNTDCEKWDSLEREFGRADILPMWVADMDFACPGAVTEAITERAAHPAYGYTIKTERDLLAVQSWMKSRHGLDTRPETYISSPGVMTSLRACLRALTCPGDGVIIQTPVYPPFIGMPAFLGRKLVVNPLKRAESGYEMDFDHLEDCMREAKVMLLCSPHNPVGRVWRRDELETLAALSRKHGVIVIADEIHHDFIYPGHEHTPILSVGGLSEEGLAISCFSGTKTFNLAGLLCSTIIIENEPLFKKISYEMQCAGIGVNLMGRIAQRVAYTSCAEWLDELLEYLRGNRDHVLEFLKNNCPGVSTSELEGTYLMWLDFNEITSDMERLKKWSVHEAGVALSFGDAFGENGAGFLRMNIACPRTQLDDALARLAGAFPLLK